MLQWILTASILITVVLLLRLLLKGKISLRLQYALWALVLVRLLLPVSIGETSLSVLNTIPQSVYAGVPEQTSVQPVSEQTAVALVPRIEGDTQIQPVDAAPLTPPAQTDTAASMNVQTKAVNWKGLVILVWVSGSAAVR